MYPDMITDMQSLSDCLTRFFFYFFSLDSTAYHHYLLRIVEFIVSEPLIMAVIAMFFAGFVVSLFIRVFHSS